MTHLTYLLTNFVHFQVSKGPNGDKLIFPSNRFIGENYINQLGVLQTVAANNGCMIAHGGQSVCNFTLLKFMATKILIFFSLNSKGNNTLGEVRDLIRLFEFNHPNPQLIY